MQRPQSPRRLFLVFLTLALFFSFLSAPALADSKKTAQDVAGKCVFSASVNQKAVSKLKNDFLYNVWSGGKNGALTVTLPKGQLCQGVMLAFHTQVPHLIVESLDDGAPQPIAEYALPYQNDYIPFSKSVHSFRIRGAEGNTADIRISRINVLTEGALPAWVQRWQTLADGAADLLLIVTHPDDDILWFGGLLPTYAGEKHKKVMVAYAVPGKRQDRRNELLDALWHCGVKYYPFVSPANADPDFVDFAVTCIRKYRPPVVVTQDQNGEYGHASHKKLVAAVIKAVKTACGDPASYAASAAQYGAYQPQKLYLHLCKKNMSIFDWRVPLKAFDGKTGMALAHRAFKMHESQQNGRHKVADYGLYDCRKFGLYFTTVGADDTRQPDFLQHVIDDKTAALPEAEARP